ncbi:MAG: hypothetical protein CMJ52_09120 [Planctomycetaceae bacterium]|nr:hypothetical protein [Planctomycetaceae bacterium]
MERRNPGHGGEPLTRNGDGPACDADRRTRDGCGVRGLHSNGRVDRAPARAPDAEQDAEADAGDNPVVVEFRGATLHPACVH